MRLLSFEAIIYFIRKRNEYHGLYDRMNINDIDAYLYVLLDQRPFY